MKKLISLSLLAAVAAAVAVVTPAPRAEAQIQMAPIGTFTLGGVAVAVACKNPGSSQDVGKTPVLTNTSSYAIPKGKSISWKSSDGDQGSLKLDADLAPGASVRALGKAGQVYTCTGNYTAFPDLTVASVLDSSSGWTVKVQNLDKHAWAGGSVLRVEQLSCGTNAVVGTAQATTESLFAGGSSTVVVAGTKVAKSYLRITTDSGKSVVEGNESNNVWMNQASCIK